MSIPVSYSLPIGQNEPALTNVVNEDGLLRDKKQAPVESGEWMVSEWSEVKLISLCSKTACFAIAA